jgi:hypothetical protein
MTATVGAKRWFIPDGYIPPVSTGCLISHESICVLNRNEEPANLRITIYFEDQPPIEGIEAVTAGRRTNHIRTSTLQKDGRSIPPGVPYAIEVESDIPVLVQYSRLDATQPANALMSVIAYPAE